MRTTLADGILTITLDNPAARNALNRAEMAALRDAFDEAAHHRAVKVIVLDHQGPTFCAGLDLGLAESLNSDTELAARTVAAANDLVASIISTPKPVVALVRGAVAGVAVPIALAADLVVCADTAAFLLAFTRIGLMPDGGSSAIVATSIGRARAMRMALLAEPLRASDAYAAGLVSHLVAADDFDDEAAQIIETLRSGPVAAYRATKRAINSATLSGLPGALDLEYTGQTGLLAGHDFAEGATAFREKRAPRFADR